MAEYVSGEGNYSEIGEDYGGLLGLLDHPTTVFGASDGSVRGRMMPLKDKTALGIFHFDRVLRDKLGTTSIFVCFTSVDVVEIGKSGTVMGYIKKSYRNFYELGSFVDIGRIEAMGEPLPRWNHGQMYCPQALAASPIIVQPNSELMPGVQAATAFNVAVGSCVRPAATQGNSGKLSRRVSNLPRLQPAIRPLTHSRSGPRIFEHGVQRQVVTDQLAQGVEQLSKGLVSLWRDLRQRRQRWGSWRRLVVADVKR